MTLLLVMEALDERLHRLGRTMVTSPPRPPPRAGARSISRKTSSSAQTEMLKSVVVSSANDCACALAEHVAGSEAAFVRA